MGGLNGTAYKDETDGPVRIGDRCVFGHNVILIGPLAIEDRCAIYSNVCIGHHAEYKDRESNTSRPIRIGSGTVIRENVVVQRGVDDDTTTISSNCYIMHGCHVAHDVKIQHGVTLAPKVVLGGHTTVMSGAYIGIAACLHQFVVIGQYAMIGMGSIVLRDVPPGFKVVGSPAVAIGINEVGLQRSGTWIDTDDIAIWEAQRNDRKLIKLKGWRPGGSFGRLYQ